MTFVVAMLLSVAASASNFAADPMPPEERTCALPAIELEDGDALLVRYLPPSSKRFANLQDNVRAGFQLACNNGLIAGSNIGELKSVPLRRMSIRNTPEGNVPSVFADQRPGGWRLVLEHPFVGSDGSIDVPTAAQIEEAVYCAVVGANDREREELGRCLVD